MFRPVPPLDWECLQSLFWSCSLYRKGKEKNNQNLPTMHKYTGLCAYPNLVNLSPSRLSVRPLPQVVPSLHGRRGSEWCWWSKKHQIFQINFFFWIRVRNVLKLACVKYFYLIPSRNVPTLWSKWLWNRWLWFRHCGFSYQMWCHLSSHSWLWEHQMEPNQQAVSEAWTPHYDQSWIQEHKMAAVFTLQIS